MPIVEDEMEGMGSNIRICVNGKEPEVVESGGRNFFTLRLDRSGISPYRIKILENLCCQALLPMHFVREDEKLHAYYDFGGCLQLKDIFPEWKKSRKNLATEMIGAVAAAAGCLVLAENYLFCCEDFLLHPDTVFVRVNTGRVKLAYIPEAAASTGLSVRFAHFVRNTAEILGDEQWAVYAEEIYRRIASCNESMSGIEKILQEKSREICSSRWPEKSALRPEAEEKLL